MRLVVFDAVKLCAKFFGSASKAAASAAGIPVNFARTLTRFRAKDGMRSA